MYEQILPSLYRLEIPLPRNPLKYLNSYLLTDNGKSLLIDTGMNREECLTEMTSLLQQLNVDLFRTDFFITHLHADHSGLVGSLAAPSSTVHIGEIDHEIMEAGAFQHTWRRNEELMEMHGFPEEELHRALSLHPGRIYSSQTRVPFHRVKDGDTINFGQYNFKCIGTPGHTPGHLCLYETTRKWFFCGDHILFDITPNITSWVGYDDSLKQYLSSLDLVNQMDIRRIFPGHRRITGEYRKRITEIKEHHAARLREVLKTLKGGEAKTAYQVAPQISWDIKCTSWDTFPPTQKVFAVGETIAHLEYLEGTKSIHRTTTGKKITFELNHP